MPLFEILRKTPDFWRPLMGFMDEQGNVVVEPQFLQNTRGFGQHFSDAGYAIVQRPGEMQHLVIDKRGDTVLALPKDHQPAWFTPPDEHGIFGVRHQVDAENSEFWQSDGRDMIFKGVTHYYAMRLDGSIAFEANFSQSCHGHYLFSDRSKRHRKQGLMDHHGRIVIPPVYDSIYLSHTDPYATVMVEGQANVLALDGTPVFPNGFKIGRSIDMGHVEDGHWIIPTPNRSRAEVFDIYSAEQVGDLPMTYWSPTIPVACPTLSGGVACVKHARKGSTYYRPDGSPAMPGILGRPRWFKPEMRTGYFYEGRTNFKLGEVWGYLDLAGKHVIPPQFDSNLSFRDGLAKVKYPADGNSWDRYSYVDREGAVVWHQ